jgi:hypothetical protein
MQNKSTQEFDDIIRNIIENQKVQEMKNTNSIMKQVHLTIVIWFHIIVIKFVKN